MNRIPGTQAHGLRIWATRAAVAGVAAAVLLGVFTLYRRPAFLVGLAEQLWSCF